MNSSRDFGFSVSNILSSNQIADLISIIGPVEYFNKLYDSTLDGDETPDFHRCCNGYSDTLTIIESENGRIAGGYSDIDWGGSQGYQKSSKAFLFSFDKKKIQRCQ